LRQDLPLPLVSRTLLRQALFHETLFGETLFRQMTFRGKTVSVFAARCRARYRLGLARRRGWVRILWKVFVRDHAWLRRRRCILGVLFIPIRARNFAERLSIAG
jgi:hypothetical protein